jgi:hypothetical protein
MLSYLCSRWIGLVAVRSESMMFFRVVLCLAGLLLYLLVKELSSDPVPPQAMGAAPNVLEVVPVEPVAMFPAPSQP